MKPLPKRARVSYPGYALHGRLVDIVEETSIAGISCWVIRNPDAEGQVCLPKDRLRIIERKGAHA